MSGLKGFIDSSGNLGIYRPRKDPNQKVQFMVCPNGRAMCSDNCPHFGDPYISGMSKMLHICHGKILQFEELADMRVEV
jgi:hypothetical protein